MCYSANSFWNKFFSRCFLCRRDAAAPQKKAEAQDARQKLIDTTAERIKKYGADSVTVRNVCEESGLSIGTFYRHFKNKGDLLMHFVREASFEGFQLETPLSDLAGRTGL